MLPFRTFITVLPLVFSALSHAGNPKIIPDRELLITQSAIIESPRALYPGPWSFGKLMEELVGPDDAPDAIRDWLVGFNTVQQIDNQFIYPRTAVLEKVIVPWQRRDGFLPATGVVWKPNLQNAPFRLLAIVNRLDLAASEVGDRFGQIRERWRIGGHEARFVSLFRDATGIDLFEQERLAALPKVRPRFNGYGIFTAAEPPPSGEGRFVFQVIDDNGSPLAGGWTIIFEYSLRAIGGRDRTRTWANAWHTLSYLDPATPLFAAQLEEVTKLFTSKVNVLNGEPILSQLRSNDAALAPAHEFRQWTIEGKRLKPALLTQTPVQQTALPNSEARRLFQRYLDGQEPLIKTGLLIVPDKFLAATAIIPPGKNAFSWDFGGNIEGDVRRTASLATCNGCHAGETACDQGFHIHPHDPGMPPVISQFLRLDGEPLRVTDPANRSGTFTYEEMKDRAKIMAAFLEPTDHQRERELREAMHKRHLRAH